MKWAASSNVFTSGKYTLIDAINKIAEARYQGIEILMDHPLLWPFEVKAKEINELQQTLEAKKLAISNLNAFTCSQYWLEKDWLRKPPKGGGPPGQKFGPCFADYEEEYRRQRIDYTKKVIDLAWKLGAKDISTCSGYPPLRGTREMAWQNMIEGLKEVVEEAEKKEIRFNIEYEPGLLVGSAAEAVKVVSEINSPYFGIHFDIGHSFVCDENISETIKMISNKIYNVHVEDIGLDEKGRPIHYHLVPGEGKMPLSVILQAFMDIGYSNWYTVEVYTLFKQPVQAIRKSIKYLKKLESSFEGRKENG